MFSFMRLIWQIPKSSKPRNIGWLTCGPTAVAVSGETLNRSWKIQDRYQLSFWDSLIVAAAKSASCRFLLTEDLQPGQDFDGLLVVNPFLRDPASLTT